ncbi:putative bifunctional diguanylate cyclase/phosphodiesterase [Comamonas nitrativorans]|uniref:Diguanylate cyclase DosC n=1 Tax=Comamonas nitrativorans TaxID=108437 RepID=A0ABV9GSI4_9BURK
MKTQPSFSKRQHFLCLGAADMHILARLSALLDAELPGFVDGFYDHLMQYPEIQALLPDAQMLERHKRLQVTYLQQLMAGHYDEAYGRSRERVGLVHAGAGLSPGWYLGAYSQYLCAFLPRIAQHPQLSPQERVAALQAVTKVVFLDMGLAIDTYITLHEQRMARLHDYSAVFTHLPYGTLVLTAQMEVVFANRAFAQLLQCPGAQLAGSPLQQWLQLDGLDCLVQRALAHEQVHDVLDVHLVGSGRVVPVAVTAHTMSALQPDADAQVLLTVVDITERHRAEQRIRSLAQFDALTGLANRQHGLALLDGLLQQARGTGQQVALLFIDLDRFKEINDTLGHSMGDRVLQAIAGQVQQLLQPGDVLARLGGDEFMLARLLPLQERGGLALVTQVDTMLQSPVQVEGRAYGISASVGVALYPDHADSVSSLLHCADLAMYRAKAQSGSYLIYEAGMRQQQSRSIALAQRLKQALADGQLELHYQPKVDTITGKLHGVEALARWRDPQWGWVSPAEFIPVAEERGLIGALDAWALETAARQWRQWQDDGWAQVPPIAVNVSAVEISMVEGFAEHALALVQRHRVPPQAIELEITETALMRNAEKAIQTTRQLVAMGFSLAIDDFGTGYSSLARLHRLSLARLKIDMTFIRTMLDDAGSMAIVTAVIGMARALQLRTVAEGVETAAQLDTLRRLQCDEIQGYFFSKPLPARELEERWLCAVDAMG